MTPHIELFWSDLLDKIEDGRVAPVIGPQLIEVTHQGRTGPLEEHLARRLIQRLGIESNGKADDRLTLFEVVAGAHRLDREADYHSLLNRLLREFSGAEPGPALAALARITDFTLYLTLGFDAQIVKALSAERHLAPADILHLAYAPNQQRTDLPRPLSALETPLVFALFGKSCPAPEFVISEEDLLEWITALQDPDNRPPLLFDALRTNHILFIGCDLPDWLLRFFIRLTRSNRISLSRSSETLIGSSQADHSRLVAFLDRFSPKTLVLDMTPQAFMTELEARWQARRAEFGGAAPPEISLLPADIRPGGVFLSYGSQDHGAATALYEALNRRQVDTWFDDQRLTSGARYDEVIERNIGRCGVLLALLSDTILARLNHWRTQEGFHPDRKPYFLREWELALARQKLQPGSLRIMPVRIDDLNLGDPLLPEGLRALTCDFAPAGRADDRLLEVIKHNVRDIRKRQREAA